MHIKKTIYLTVLLLSICGMDSYASDLLHAYSLAESSDPLYREAIASYRATLESKPQARSQLLPNISLNANTFSNDQDISTAGIGTSGDVSFNSHRYSLDITQPIYHHNLFTLGPR